MPASNLDKAVALFDKGQKQRWGGFMLGKPFRDHYWRTMTGDSPARASSPDDVIYRQLTSKGDESVSALDTVLKQAEAYPPRYSTTLLLSRFAKIGLTMPGSSSTSHDFACDLINNFSLRLALVETAQWLHSPHLIRRLGSVVNPAIMSKPEVFEKVLARVKSWTPTTPIDFEPGWGVCQSRERGARGKGHGRVA